jgi:hypothetical protein
MPDLVVGVVVAPARIPDQLHLLVQPAEAKIDRVVAGEAAALQLGMADHDAGVHHGDRHGA